MKYAAVLCYISFSFVLDWLLVPFIDPAYQIQAKTMINRLHALMSELGITILAVALILGRDKENNRDAPLIAMVFLAAFIADLIYMIAEFYPGYIPACPIFIRGLCYNFFLGGLLYWLVRNFGRSLLNFPSIILIIIEACFFAFLISKYVVTPFFTDITDIWLILNGACFTVLEAAIISIIIPCAIRENSLPVHLLLQAVFLICISDFSIRYQPMSTGYFDLNRFEFGWQIAIALCFMLFLTNKSSDLLSESEQIPFYSARSMLVFIVITFIGCFVSLLLGFKLYKVGDAFHLTNILMICYILWLFSNLLAQFISSGLLTVNKTISLMNNSNERDTLFKNKFLNLFPRYQMLSELNRLLDSVLDQSKLAAIGQTTSILAHDLRKPFSQIEMVLKSFDFYKVNPSKLERAKVDIGKSLAHIDNMLGDIMNFSRKIDLSTAPESLGDILDFSIRQTLSSHSGIDVSLSYDFKADVMPYADAERLARVFSNILDNAADALAEKGNSGKIWIRTRKIKESRRFMVEITIGNDGPLIPLKRVDRLFESFYTSGKRHGTGLGLASARKIIKLHQGSIHASNRVDGKGVEFVITLPASTVNETSAFDRLPVSHNDIRPAEYSTENQDLLLYMLEEQNAPIKILLLEDEVLYRAWVKNLINENPSLRNLVTVYDASTVEEALQVVEKECPNYAVVDIDLADAMDGFDFIRTVNDSFPDMSILLHSNRSDKLIDKSKLTGQVLSVVAKPLSFPALVKFLASPFSNSEGDSKTTDLSTSGELREIAFVEDDDLMRRLMTRSFKDAKVHAFCSPEDFWLKTSQSPEFLSSLSCIITDYYFDESPGGKNGLDFAAEIKRNSSLPVLLCSNADFGKEVFEIVDGLLPKDPSSWNSLDNLFEYVQSKASLEDKETTGSSFVKSSTM